MISDSEDEDFHVIFLEFYVTNPSTSLTNFIKLREENLQKMAANHYDNLRVEMEARVAQNPALEISELMKVKYLFFDWIVNSEQAEVVVDGNPQRAIPASWTNDKTRDYKIRYLGQQEFDVAFSKPTQGVGISIQSVMKTKLNVFRSVFAPPTFVCPNDEERRQDKRRCVGIISSYITWFRPLLVRVGLGINTRKRPHCSDSSSSLADHPND